MIQKYRDEGSGTMHICLAGAKSCPPVIGGIEVFIFEVGRRLVSKGAEVTVIVPRGKDQKKTETVDGISVRRISAIRNRYSLKVSMMPGELRIGAEVRPDVFHANDPPSGIVSLLSNRWKSRVLTVHGIGVSPSEWPTPFRQGGRFLQSIAVGGATVVTTTDEATATMLREIRKEVVVIPPGVDTKMFGRATYSRPDIFDADRVNILFIGRLTRVKGIDLLLESLDLIKTDILARIRLTVIGSGPLATAVQRYGTTRHQVRLVGEVPHKDIPNYLAHADLLVMPSRSEGLPISMLEAMSSGLPVVATTVGGIGTYFDDRHLMRIESLTAQGVADAIEHAVENKSLMEGRARTARNLVESQFSWDRVAEAYLRLYEEITR